MARLNSHIGLLLVLAGVLLLSLPTAASAAVAHFSDKTTFLNFTEATSATGAIPNLGAAGAQVTLGSVTLDTFGNDTCPSYCNLWVGASWTDLLPGNEIAIDGRESIDVRPASTVNALGFDFIEPTDLASCAAPCVESTFSLALKRGAATIGSFSFNVPNDTAAFVGAASSLAFDRVEIRETAGDIDDEFYGQFYTRAVSDTDGDAVPDASDNCPSAANVDQADLDKDGRGDVCDQSDDRYPDTAITAGPTGTTTDPMPLFSFVSTLPGSTLQCRVDGDLWSACTAPHRTRQLLKGRHGFEARAISPGGFADPTPAQRVFDVEVPPTTTRLSCRVQPFYSWIVELVKTGTDGPAPNQEACMVGKRPSFGCPKDTRCTWTSETCPRGARCTLTADVAWYDADLNVNWGGDVDVFFGVLTRFGEAPYMYGKPPNKGGGYSFCQTGFDGDRCFAHTTLTALGDGSPVYIGCTFHTDYGIMSPATYFRDDDVRRIECSADLKVEGAEPLVAVSGGGLRVFVVAPGPGTLTVVPKILSLAAKTAQAAKAQRPRVSPIRRPVTQAGSVSIPLELDPAAKRLLAQRKELTVRLKTTFAAPDGGLMTKTSRVALTSPPKPKRCMSKRLTDCLLTPR